jgi:hypothetical protein
MALSKESADALRECVRILAAKYRDPQQRTTMARNAEQYIQEGKWLPAFTIVDIPLLFYPDDPDRARAMHEAMQAALAAGELAPMPGGHSDRLMPSNLAAWAGCPRVPKRSPLRFWLPDFMQEADAAQAPSNGGETLARERGPSSAAGRAARQARAVDWTEWSYARDVKLWEAVALSLNIEPTKVRFSQHGWMAGPGHVFTEEGDEFDKRLRMAGRALNHGLDLAWIAMGDPGRSGVFLAQFASWALTVGWDVPDELRHLVANGAAPKEPEPSGAEQGIGDWLRADLWTLYEAAYLLADAMPRDETAFVAADRDAGGAVGKAYRALKDATLAGSLPFIEVDGVLLRRRIKPADAVEWAVQRGMPVPEEMRSLVTSNANADALDGADSQSDSLLGPLSRQRWQEGRIVEVLRALGHDPQALVRAARGRRDDPKAQCRAYLREQDGQYSWTSGIFDKAWERCRKNGSVSDAPGAP